MSSLDALDRVNRGGSYRAIRWFWSDHDPPKERFSNVGFRTRLTGRHPR